MFDVIKNYIRYVMFEKNAMGMKGNNVSLIWKMEKIN